MSLEKDIPYPKFLMVDTPETAGIDANNLNKVIHSIVDLSKCYGEQNFQAIMATGVNKYPNDMKGYVVITLSDDSKLLQPVS